MRERLNKIRLLLLDVDGVMTDGRIIYSSDGLETKAFDVKDGHGLKLLQRAGFKLGIITGRQSDIVAGRAAELGIEIVHQGCKNKLEPYQSILEETGFSDEQVAYVGDDVIDLPVLNRVGFAATVRDAVDDIKPYVHYVTEKDGGKGAVREICDLLLKQTGRWAEVTDRYFPRPTS